MYLPPGPFPGAFFLVWIANTSLKHVQHSVMICPHKKAAPDFPNSTTVPASQFNNYMLMCVSHQLLLHNCSLSRLCFSLLTRVTLDQTILLTCCSFKVFSIRIHPIYHHHATFLKTRSYCSSAHKHFMLPFWIE